MASAYCLSSRLVPCASHAVKEHGKTPTPLHTPGKARRAFGLCVCVHNRDSLNGTRANRASQGRGDDDDDDGGVDDDDALTSGSARRLGKHVRAQLCFCRRPRNGDDRRTSMTFFCSSRVTAFAAHCCSRETRPFLSLTYPLLRVAKLCGTSSPALGRTRR